MARRASSSAHPIWIVVVVLLVVAAIGGGFLLFKSASDPFRTITPLPIEDYLENSNSLRGNVYKIDGTVAKSLAWSQTAGRLFSVEVRRPGAAGARSAGVQQAEYRARAALFF